MLNCFDKSVTTKTILYISYDGMTDPLGQSQVLPYLCGLSASGYVIHLISAEKPDNFGQMRFEIEAICKANNIQWHPVTYTKNPPIVSTINDIRKISQLAKSLHSQFSFDLVHCRSYISGIIGLRLKREYKIPFLFDMRGLWVDEKVDGNIWNLNNPVFKIIYNYFKKKEKELFKEADGLISLTHKACTVIHTIQPNPVKHQRIQVIPCCADVNHFNPILTTSAGVDEWKNKLGIKDSDFIFAYLGSFSTWYLPKEMLQFFKRLLLHKPESRFLVITHDSAELLLKYANECGVPAEKIIITKSNRKELPALLKLIHTSISFIKPSFSKIASSPTKIGELLSMGIPVVCNKGIGDTDEIILQSGAGVVCSGYTDDQYDQAIEDLLRLQRVVSPEKIREEAIRIFSLEEGVSKYKAMYDHLTSHS